MQIERLDVADGQPREEIRQAAALAVLTATASENRVLISDIRGSRADEVQMWRWLASNGLATITDTFTQRPEPLRGYPVFDGAAFASPDHIDRLGAMSSV